MKIESVIIKPVLTEKATQAATGKIYTFEVGKKANKNQVKEVLQKVYNVKVSDVRIAIRKGKNKHVGRKNIVKKEADRKIAVVRVSEGTINVFPQA